jgi:hypothetical protein
MKARSPDGERASRSRSLARLVAGAFLACLLTGSLPSADAQDIEPRLFSNAPVGLNFLIVGYTDARGAVPFDPSIPITEARITTSSAILAYARVLELWGKSAKFDAIFPYSSLSGTALYVGEPVRRDVDGFVDPRFRLSVNLHGAPALKLREYASYRQDVLVGASVQVSAPVGQYDPARMVNIGTNRWSFKPEAGVSKVLGPWTLELAGAVTFYTDNELFYNGSQRSQAPLYAVQAHVVRGFRSGIWASGDATYFTGGRTTIDGTLKNDLQRNWRLGGTLAFPVGKRNSVKLYASSGASARTGNNFDLFGIGWQYRWGGGL